jgi:plasmid stabilization system protein ParE
MVMRRYKVIWTTLAKQDLRSIYQYWQPISEKGAKNIVEDTLRSPKTIYYSQQYQVDDVNSKYRRIVVRKFYKVLYRERKNTIYIMGVITTHQSPDIVKHR